MRLYEVTLTTPNGRQNKKHVFAPSINDAMLLALSNENVKGGVVQYERMEADLIIDEGNILRHTKLIKI